MADDTPSSPAPANTSAQAAADQAQATEPDSKPAYAPAAAAPPPGQGGQAGPPPWRSPDFLARVNGWVNGKDVPTDATTAGAIEDLRGNLAERQQTTQQVGQIEQALREGQARVIGSQGQEEALLKVLFRAQSQAADKQA